MKKFRAWGLTALSSALLVACGGGGDGDQSPRVSYGKLVSFGDSLSDVGSYRVGAIAALGGGEYSVNGTPNVNWTEQLAAQAKVAAPCAAQTGLQSNIPTVPAVPVAFNAACTNYAQGGSRVTNPVGVGNVALGGASIGQLTVPIVTQIQNHLVKAGGSFASDDLVTVLAGGNDAIINTAAVGQGLPPTAAVTALATAGGELAAYIKNLIVAKGATRVVVVNLPDLSQTPFGLAQSAQAQVLINTMVTTFNQQLASGLSGVPGVLIVDAYTQGRDQTAHPDQYSLTNVTTPACDLAHMPLPTSLVCTGQTLIAGDVSHYEYADTVHPTPYGYQLLARYVLSQMLKVGWL